MNWFEVLHTIFTSSCLELVGTQVPNHNQQPGQCFHPLPPEAKEEKRRPKEDAIIKATDLAALNSCALEQRVSYLKTTQCGATYPEATTINATDMDNSTNTNLTSEGINTRLTRTGKSHTAIISGKSWRKPVRNSGVGSCKNVSQSSCTWRT